MQNICLLGATGSIGSSTLDLISQHPDKFKLISAAANESVERMVEICHEFQPERVVMGSERARDAVAHACPNLPIQFDCSAEAMTEIASESNVDQVVAAIVGFAGLTSTLSAIRAGKRVLLANKESLVTAGKLFMDEVSKHNVTLMPIDSEHNAIYQCLPQNESGAIKRSVDKILLTASGGPFRNFSNEEMLSVTPEQACKHPNWSMGRKISVDSASMMNKGLELIEACWLFDVEPDDIEVVIHPQSIIHSMVSYDDGSVIAQMGNPDMKVPIAYGMTWPERITTRVEPLNLFEIAQLDFSKPDLDKFPNLRLAADAWYIGGTAMASLNAANEIAVDAFLNKRIGFLDIAKINTEVLEQTAVFPVTDLEAVFDADKVARQKANDVINSKAFL
ncbi:1-deoxy-D-xylulose 5-phosphate reductoisomerase [Marinomonas sp. S3726]|uniref:1-deoxy-D-xylulose-5-phosphate reductoisomerase n=1 Tax=Marinomonas sp. S3726 TaxID=579484 RepID=UPI0005FA5F5A|nr:1-deoxy-D-xylulose-5-phosphate reductoisomerase [Marinomonas sp. S3726]KJZ11034.1 1-deoxy-D-xylulose 5-phosphate reductoisomerase [Marinomonas sp. S3726]